MHYFHRLPLIICLVFCHFVMAEITYYISPTGNDDNSGLAPDSPFLTLGKAQEAVRLNSQRGIEPIRVQLREGTYFLDDTWEFSRKDSGSEQAPVTWQSYPGEQAVISGGRIITGWIIGPNGTWSVTIPEAVNANLDSSKWNINQLFVNGERRPRCRMPKAPEFFRMNGRPYPWEDKKDAKGHEEAYTQLVYHEEDLGSLFHREGIPSQYDITNAQVWLYNSWTASIHNLDEIRFDEHRLVFSHSCKTPVGSWEANGRYHIENVRAACTDPGEWYMDYHTGTLHYIPKPGETPENTTVIAPILSILLKLSGNAKSGQTVQYLNFDNMSFCYSAYPMSHNEVHSGQAASFAGGTIKLQNTLHCQLTHLTIAHIGLYGIQLAKGCSYNTIQQCELTDLGAGGIRIGTLEGDAKQETACGHNLIDNCFIHDGGLIQFAAVGYIVFKSSYNTLRHSEICDMNYSAVSLGWSWGYTPSKANHNIVEFCRFHHIGYGILSDMGGVYTLGISPGTIIRGNIIHDIFSYDYGGWGLYTDEGSTGIIIENNIVYNTKSGGFHQHYGKDNIVRNNILAFSQEGQIIRTRREEAHSSFSCENNIIVFDNGQPYGGDMGNGNCIMTNNIYWDTTEKTFTFCGKSLQELQNQDNCECNSVIADPKFTNPRNGDFTPLPDSPYTSRIQSILDATRYAGLYGPSEWVNKPKTLSFKTVSPAMRPPHVTPPDYQKTAK